MSAFDPYHRWLGIPPQDQPPTAYRLLGLIDFESDLEVIRDAAERQASHVRKYQLGEHQALSQKILNELAAAKAQLENPAAKAKYDAELRCRKFPPVPPSVTPPPPVAAPPVKRLPPPASSLQLAPAQAPLHLSKPAAASPTKKSPPKPATKPASLIDGSYVKRQPLAQRSPLLLICGGSGVAILLVVGLLLWLGSSPVDLAPAIQATKPAPAGERPALVGPVEQLAKAGERVEFSVQNVNTHIPAHQLEFRLGRTAPSGATIDSRTGRVEWTPPADHPGGKVAVVVEAVAGPAGKRANVAVAVVVERAPNNLAPASTVTATMVARPEPPPVVPPQPAPSHLTPVVEPLTEQQAVVGQEFKMRVIARDPNAQQSELSFRFPKGFTRGMQIHAQTGELTWTPEPDQVGRAEVLIEASLPQHKLQTTFTLSVNVQLPMPPTIPPGLQTMVQTGPIGAPKLCFSADGKYLFSATHGRYAYIWEVETGLKIRHIILPVSIADMAVSPDGESLLIGMKSGTAKLYSVSTGKELRTVAPDRTATGGGFVAISSDGKSLALTQSNERGTDSVFICDLESGRKIHTFEQSAGTTNGLFFSPNNRFILRTSESGQIALWNLSTRKEIPVGAELRGAARFRPQGEVVICTPDTLIFVDATSGTVLRKTAYSNPDYRPGWGASLSPDGTMVALETFGKVKAWDLFTGVVRHTGPEVYISITFDPTGKYLASISSSATIQLWDLARHAHVPVFDSSHPLHRFRESRFNEEGRAWAATGKPLSGWLTEDFKEDAIFLPDLAHYRARFGIKVPEEAWNFTMQVTPDGKQFCARCKDRTFRFWDVASRQQVATFLLPEGAPTVHLSADGQRLLALGNKILKVWEVRGTEVQTVSPLKFRSLNHKVAFSPAGDRWVVNGYSGELELWSVTGEKAVRRFKHGGHGFEHAIFSADGKELLTCARAGIYLWNVDTGAMIQSFMGHEFPDKVGFLAGRRQILSKSNATMKLWDIQSGKELLCWYDFRFTDWLAVTPEGYFDGTPEAMRYVTWTEGMKVHPPGTFQAHFHRPDLVQKALQTGQSETKR